jgi:hypothetical protein
MLIRVLFAKASTIAACSLSSHADIILEIHEFLYFNRYYQMPPKKEEEPTVLLGRFGTSLKIGIVGLPNVGFV